MVTQITIQDLLAMRSGLFDFANDQDFFARYTADPTLPWTTEDALRDHAGHAAEATAPNETSAYNNGNYVLLGLVIERVTGQTVQDHLTGLIGELGLTSTSYPAGDTLPEPYVSGYYSDGTTPPPAGGYRDVTLQQPGRRRGRGGADLDRSGHDPLRRRARHRHRADAGDAAAAADLGPALDVRCPAAIRPGDHPARRLVGARRVDARLQQHGVLPAERAGGRGRHEQRGRRDRGAVAGPVGRGGQVALPGLAAALALIVRPVTPNRPAMSASVGPRLGLSGGRRLA